MREQQHAWAIVLAAGEGSRLEALTTDLDGQVVPKQFCSLDGGPTMLERTLARARSIVDDERVVTMVAARQRAHWEPLLGGTIARNVIVEPRGRGTAVGLVLPLLSILARDPEATVVVLPSDHCVLRETILQIAILEALHRVRGGARGPILLGVTPDEAVADYGWILPEPAAGRLHRIRRFVEKPPPSEAAELFGAGALWNSFILVARGQALLDLIELELPALVEAFRGLSIRESLEQIYARIDAFDLSRDVLQKHPAELRVQQLPPCGWTDLGTPERVAACLRGRAQPALSPAGMRAAPVLASALDRFRSGPAWGPSHGRSAEHGVARRPPEAACS